MRFRCLQPNISALSIVMIDNAFSLFTAKYFSFKHCDHRQDDCSIVLKHVIMRRNKL